MGADEIASHGVNDIYLFVVRHGGRTLRVVELHDAIDGPPRQSGFFSSFTGLSSPVWVQMRPFSFILAGVNCGTAKP